MQISNLYGLSCYSQFLPHSAYQFAPIEVSVAMDKDQNTMDIMDPYVAKGGLQDGLPTAEVSGDRDEYDLAVFGKRQQLKVGLPSPRLLILKSLNSEISASFPSSA